MSGKSNLNLLNLRSFDGKIAGLYDLKETLGRGHYAVVKLAKHVFTGEKVAVKVIDKSKLDEVSRTHIFQEVRCMKLVQHPNVVRLYEVIDTQTKLYLILELGDGGDLYDYIMKHEGGLTEEMAKKYFLQILRAISYCHRLHIVHRDLKPENVVFFEKERLVKITDFGFSNKFNPGQKMETFCGSLAYSAPEILLGESYDAPAVDVWSLGVILYMLVCGSAPFQEANDSETLTMIMDCKYNLPDNVSSECKNLILKMLVRNPEHRATLEEIANDAWLKNVDKDEREDSYYLPLVSRQEISEDDHNLIIQKMENGKIATKDEIAKALEKNPYNHITSTYYLLAERTLRLKRQELISKKRPNLLVIPKSNDKPDHSSNNTLKVSTNLQVPWTPGNSFQRGRKCSIVQEEEEDMFSSDREDLENASKNCRCSKSESKLNALVQDKLKISDTDQGQTPKPHSSNRTKVFDERCLWVPVKNRTTSCSSSDASEDENSYEARHKREQQSILIGSDYKPILVIRRDSHDDSSDSQDTCSDSGRLSSNTGLKFDKTYYRTSSVSDNNNNNNTSNKSSNKSCKNVKTKRKSKEVRLKESQSLNRIAEVQEDVCVLRRMAHVKKPLSLLTNSYTDDELLHSSASSRSNLIADSGSSRHSTTMKRINVTLSGFFKHSLHKSGGSHLKKCASSMTYVDSRLTLFRKFHKDFFSTKTKANVF